MRVSTLLPALIVLAACAGPGPDTGVSTTSPFIPPTTSAPPATPTTTAPGTTSSLATTTTTGTGTAWPGFFVVDEAGLHRVEAGKSQLIAAGEVWNAASDYAGGVAFMRRDESGDVELMWLPADRSEPVAVPEIRFPLPAMTAVLDRSPVIVGWGPTDTGDVEQELSLITWSFHDDTTTSHPVGFGFWGDAGGHVPASVAEHLVVGTSFATVGSLGTSQTVIFWDLDTAREITELPNPFTRSCQPCELGVWLSPDGSHLAYLHRPDAKWPVDWDDAPEVDALTWEEWWETSKLIPGEVVVLDLDSGVEAFRAEVEAGWRLGGFDGRVVVLHSTWASDTPTTMLLDTAEPGQSGVVDGHVSLMMTIEGD